MNDVASLCVADMTAHLSKLIAAGKVLHVYGEEELMDKTKGLQFPAAGVVYEGLRAKPEGGKDTGKMGIPSEIVVSLMVLQRPDTLTAANTKVTAMNLLDDIRAEILGSRAPTGHYWKFVVEAPALEKNGVVIWLQRWSTSVQLVPVVR